jgi:HD-GYP domain-containing protein (c-di-GMP phosphodiesterase class II)
MEILSPLAHLGPVLRFVADHHERWDGRGYPRGLKGEEISAGGRILAAVDAFDAVTSRRAYQEPMSSEQAISYLATHSGTLMDPSVYAALRKVVETRKALTFIDDVHG